MPVVPTDEAASAGLDWTLAHELTGDLDRQHTVAKPDRGLATSEKHLNCSSASFWLVSWYVARRANSYLRLRPLT